MQCEVRDRWVSPGGESRTGQGEAVQLSGGVLKRGREKNQKREKQVEGTLQVRFQSSTSSQGQNAHFRETADLAADWRRSHEKGEEALAVSLD